MAFIVSDDSSKELNAAVLAFTQSLKNAGFDLTEPIQKDGEVYRVHVNGDKDGSLNGWYSFHGTFGWYGSWKNHDAGNSGWHKWTATPEESLTAEEKAGLHAEQERVQDDLATIRQDRQEDARERATRLWNAAQEDLNHPYLIAKGLTKTYGSRVYKRMLLIPLEDPEGTLQTLIRIWPDGTKKLLNGGKKAGGFFVIGALTPLICLCEGFATGASIHEATQHCVFCCGDCNNLAEVANALKAKYPTHTFLIAGDNDHDKPYNAGAKAAKAAAESLACDYVLPDFSGVKGSEQASDFNDLMQLAGGEEVKRQLTDNRKPSDAKVIGELLRLSPLEYDRVREANAKQLGCRTSTLDEQVKRARPPVEDSPDNGKPLTLESPIPWPSPVNGAELLTEIRDTFKRFVIMPKGGYDALALWDLHTYCYDVFYVSPILGIMSPEKRCGKTTLLSLLALLTNRPLPTSNISPAALFRCVEKWSPTLLVDEADTFLKDNEELRGIFNSGHTKATAYVIRTVGDDHEPRRFSTWCPKAIALIGRLPTTLHDRAIGIAMQRKLVGEQVEKFREDKLNVEALCQKAQRWAQDHLAALKSQEPEMPEGLNDRTADNWRSLLSIADVAGGEWPTLARKAIETLAGGDDDHEEARIKLLADIRGVFKDRNTDRITSAEMVAALVEMEDRPWPEWKHGKPLTQNQLARLLRPFKIKPETLRTDTKRAKGYQLEEFTDAFNRYLPGISNRDTVTMQQPCGSQPNSNRDSNTQCHGSEIAETHTMTDLSRCHGSEYPNTEDNSYRRMQRRNDHLPPSQRGTLEQPSNDGGSSDFQSGTAKPDVPDQKPPEPAPEATITRFHVNRKDKDRHIPISEEEDLCLSILRHYHIEYRYITTESEAQAAIEQLLRKDNTKALGLDTETMPLEAYRHEAGAGLDPYQATIRLIQIYDGENTVYLFDLAHLDIETLKPLGTRPFVCHNAVFDAKFLLKAGIRPRLHCTKIMGRLVTGRIRDLSLAALSKEFLGWELDKTLQISDWSRASLKPQQLRYAALDAVLVTKLAQQLKAKLEQQGQLKAYLQLQPLISIVAKQELHGCPFDADAHTALVHLWTDERNHLEKSIYQTLGDTTLNIDSGQQLGSWLETQLPKDVLESWPRTSSGKLKTDKGTLALYGELGIITPLLQYKHLTKRLSTYGNDYLQNINPVTNRLHPSYFICGTAVGKFSCSKPNLMQLPRDAEVRALIKAPEGRVIVCADFSQLELRIAAELSQDAALLQAYQAGVDVHTKTASVIAGVPIDEVTKQHRQAAKACNFGLLYGQGARGLAHYAKASYGVDMSLAQANQAREAFFNAYPGLRQW